jgi:hypothetical protein
VAHLPLSRTKRGCVLLDCHATAGRANVQPSLDEATLPEVAMPAFKNITGLRVGRLVALERQGSNRRGDALWLCLCDCGRTPVVVGNNLTRAHTLSCGCRRGEVAAARRTTHGQSGTRTHAIWKAMRDRCRNPRNKQWKNYGGRGIKDRYPGFEAFLADMGEQQPGCDLHRKENDGDYEPGNCEWLSRSEHRRAHARRRKATSPPQPSEGAR